MITQEKIEVLRIDENECSYDYNTNILTINGKVQSMLENEYIEKRNDSIAFRIKDNVKIELFLNGEKIELPLVEETYNFRPVARIIGKGQYKGIQGVKEDGSLALGGNIIHQSIYWGKTERQANELLEKLASQFLNYEFKLIKN